VFPGSSPRLFFAKYTEKPHKKLFNEVPAEQKQSGNCGEYRKKYLKNIPARIRVDVGAGGCWKKDNGGEYHYK